MAAVEKFGRHDITKRIMHLLEIDSVNDWPEEIQLNSPQFVLFLACDATDLEDDELQAFAGKAIEQGMVYLSTWGPGAERVHDIFEEVEGDRNPDSNANSVVLSEWHEEEPLAEALRFAVATASPAHDYEKTCKATLCVSVGNPDWAEQIRGWLDEPATLDEAIGEEEDGDEGEDLDDDQDTDENDHDCAWCGGEIDQEYAYHECDTCGNQCCSRDCMESHCESTGCLHDFATVPAPLWFSNSAGGHVAVSDVHEPGRIGETCDWAGCTNPIDKPHSALCATHRALGSNEPRALPRGASSDEGEGHAGQSTGCLALVLAFAASAAGLVLLALAWLAHHPGAL